MKRLCPIFAVSLFAATAYADAPASVRVRATPSWSIVIPRELKQVDNGDSWQAAEDDRVVYVSAMLVSSDRNDSVVTTAASLTAKLLNGVPGKMGPSMQHHANDVEGRAALFHTQSGFELKGFMIAKDRVVVCVVSFVDSKYRSWAIDTWRSLQRVSKSPAEQTK